MVLPVYKVISLLIRVLSRPLINYTKQVHLKSQGLQQPTRLRSSFIRLGNTYNRWEGWINRKFMKIQTQFAYKPLNDELACQKGIQFFYEMLFYSLVIGLPLYELHRTGKQAKQKSSKVNNKMEELQKNEKDIIEQLKEMKKQFEQIKVKRKKKQIIYHRVLNSPLCNQNIEFLHENEYEIHIYQMCYI